MLKCMDCGDEMRGISESITVKELRCLDCYKKRINMKIKYKKVTVKKLFMGRVSVRSYIIDKIIKENKGLLIKYQSDSMKIEPENVKKFEQLTQDIHQNKFSAIKYRLYDYVFKKDNQ